MNDNDIENIKLGVNNLLNGDHTGETSKEMEQRLIDTLNVLEILHKPRFQSPVIIEASKGRNISTKFEAHTFRQEDYIPLAEEIVDNIKQELEPLIMEVYGSHTSRMIDHRILKVLNFYRSSGLYPIPVYCIKPIKVTLDINLGGLSESKDILLETLFKPQASRSESVSKIRWKKPRQLDYERRHGIK